MRTWPSSRVRSTWEWATSWTRRPATRSAPVVTRSCLPTPTTSPIPSDRRPSCSMGRARSNSSTSTRPTIRATPRSRALNRGAAKPSPPPEPRSLLASAVAAIAQNAEVEAGSEIPFNTRDLEEIGRALRILGQYVALGISDGHVVAGPRQTQRAGAVIERQLPCQIFRHAFALVVERSKVGATQGLVTVAGPLEESGGRRRVLGDLLAVDEEESQLVAGTRVVRVAGLAVERHGTGAVVLDSGAVQIRSRQVVAAQHAVAVAPPLVKLEGPDVVRLDAVAGGEHGARLGAGLGQALFAGPVEELDGPSLVLRDALPAAIENPQVVAAERISDCTGIPFAGAPVELRGPRIALRHSPAVVAQKAEVGAGEEAPGFTTLGQGRESAGIVFLDSAAVFVHHAHVVAARGVPAIAGSHVELRGPGIVPRHSPAGSVQERVRGARIGAALPAGLLEQGESAGVVLGHSLSVEVSTAESGAALGIAAVAGLRVERRRGPGAFRARPLKRVDRPQRPAAPSIPSVAESREQLDRVRELQDDLQFVLGALDRERHLLAGGSLHHSLQESARRLDRDPVDRLNQIACGQPGLGRGSPAENLLEERASRPGRKTEVSHGAGRQVHHLPSNRW